jgi:hypothetical protein
MFCQSSAYHSFSVLTLLFWLAFLPIKPCKHGLIGKLYIGPYIGPRNPMYGNVLPIHTLLLHWHFFQSSHVNMAWLEIRTLVPEIQCMAMFCQSVHCSYIEPYIAFQCIHWFFDWPPWIMMTDSSQIGARPALAGIEDSSMRRTQLPLLLRHVAASDTQ